MKSIMSRKKPAKAEKIQKNLVESHEEKIAQMLSAYATSPLEKMDKSITIGSFFWKNKAQGDSWRDLVASAVFTDRLVAISRLLL